MLHWALPAHHFGLYEEFEQLLKSQNLLDKYGSFFKAGSGGTFWPNTRVQRHAQKDAPGVAQGRRGRAKGPRKARPAALRKATDHVLAAQCNDPYWHGIFGGLYLPNLRYPIYKNLLEAERLLDGTGKGGRLSAETVDFDGDGMDEVLVESR